MVNGDDLYTINGNVFYTMNTVHIQITKIHYMLHMYFCNNFFYRIWENEMKLKKNSIIIIEQNGSIKSLAGKKIRIFTRHFAFKAIIN